jgi:hypothetical protein
MRTLVSERKSSITVLEVSKLPFFSFCYYNMCACVYLKLIYFLQDFVHSQGRSLNVHTIIMTEGNETVDFKLQFQLWPKNVELMLYESGREKVAGWNSLVALYIKYFHIKFGKDHETYPNLLGTERLGCCCLEKIMTRSNTTSLCSNFQASRLRCHRNF